MDKAVTLYGNDKLKVLSGYAFKQLSDKELLSLKDFCLIAILILMFLFIQKNIWKGLFPMVLVLH